MVNDPLDFSEFENAYNQRAAQRGHGLNLRFYSDTKQNAAETLKAGRPIYDIIDYVAVNVPGSRDEHVMKMTNPEAQQRFGHEYEKWKQTQEQPEDGTPLTVVPFLNIAQVRELAAINIKTLEQLAGLSDLMVQKTGMGGIELRKKAQSYMKAATDSAQTGKLIDEVKKLTVDNQQLKEQLHLANSRYEALLAGNGPGVPQQMAANLDIQAMIRAEMARVMGEPK
jgi:hypothetical protein